MSVTIFCPTLTYQYSRSGELDTSHGGDIELPFDETIRERFRAMIEARYTNFPAAWDRLCELERGMLDRLPDNPFVLQDAWVCGLIDDPPEFVRGLYIRLAKQREWDAEETRQQAEREARRNHLRSQVACTVLREYSVPAEVGRDPGARVRIRSLADGSELEFECRNIFDFGYVVNPLYPIAPGKKPGGIVNIDPATKARFWMDFDGKGWQRIRDLTPFESLAIAYLDEFPPIADGIRM